MPEPVANFKL